VGELPIEEDVDRELRSHLALRAEELEGEGWDPAAARAEAERVFGDVDDIRRTCESLARRRDRRIRRTRGWEAVMQDIRYAVRSLTRSPSFALVALLTLALGIGANTAIFSVVEGVLLRPLPFDQPDRLVSIQERGQRDGTMNVAWPNFEDWQRESQSFEALAAHGVGEMTILGGQEPLRVQTARVTQAFWRTMRVQPLAGRLTGADDHQEGAAVAVVITRALSLRLFGVADATGRALDAQGIPAQVVGVVPSDFAYPSEAELWYPLELFPQGTSRTAHNYAVTGRLAEGVSRDRAFEDLDAMTVRMLSGEPSDDRDFLAAGVWMIPLRDALVGDVSRPLMLLLGAAGFVLLVACTNLASTLLARGRVRTQEFAVRSSLGAGRARLVRQLVTESGVLAVVGAVLGLGLATLLLRLIQALGSEIPRMESVGLSAAVLAFTGVVTIATALAFGLLPALRLTDGAQATTLRGRSRGSSGGRTRLWGLLVATEVALALVLLMGSGLLIRSFGQVLGEDPGFDASDVVSSAVALSANRYPTPADHTRFYDDLIARLEGLRSVESAGLISVLPLSGGASNGRIQLDGDPDKNTGSNSPVYLVASEGAFDALDIPLVRGRVFDERDGPEAPHAVVVNQAFVDQFWPDVDPIGRQVTGGGMDNYWDAETMAWGTVVGVVDDVRYRDLTSRPAPAVYWSYRQRPYRIRFGANLVAEARGSEASAITAEVRTVVRQANADIAVEVGLLADQVDASLAERRFMLLILGGFSMLAVGLAAVGIYGVVSYTVARRTREMGIRLALGAAPTDVRALVLRGVIGMVGLGLVAGLFGAFLVTRTLSSFLYETSTTDPLTFVAVPALLFCTALLASWVPASRSTRVDPISTMRSE
jgi:predicted permease